MAKMSKKFEEEYDFYIKRGLKRKRVGYCEKCKQCKNDCKQSFHITELRCPNFTPKEKVSGI